MAANATFFIKRMNDYAAADDWAGFWRMVEAYGWSTSAYLKC